MADTIMSTKNTFSEGLVMDFAPDNTLATTLTSALNATLLTFNGNEMSLLNDMGNGRVETAHLPEGYIPVGTCEYGDIIYIVSYNPLLNKSQIGCFPSPERNISSDEVINGGDKLQISESLFLKPVKDGFNMKEVTTTSAKFVLTKKNLNPGDKYIIYTDNIFNEPYITDIGNTDHDFGKFPKYLKIHVISIDNSNKIDYLDSDVVWYDKIAESIRKDYFINEINKNYTDKPDIDSYRNALSSGYSIFQSKVSGKLALLVELETINTFSCTYNIYKHSGINSKSNISYLDYDIYFNINWQTDNNNVNPSQICLYNLYWSGVEDNYKGKALLWWENKDNKYILGKPKQNELASNGQKPNYLLPIELSVKSIQDSNNWEEVYKKDITRSYLPENNISYDEFKTKASYDKILENTLKYIKYTLYIADNPKIGDIVIKCNQLKNNKGAVQPNWLEIDTSDISLSSVIIDRDKGAPKEGQYYVNANSVFLQDGQLQYYTSYKDTEIKIYPYEITDDIINNYFRYPISKKFASISIPVKLIIGNAELIPSISNLVYNYEVAPVMPYGILPHLRAKGTINFSKIGSGEINLTKWKYYNTENTSTLTIGFNIFPEENMGVAGIDIEFLDNLGVAAIYNFDSSSSYSGTFTDLIPLNNSFSNYKLNKVGIHAGLLDEKSSIYYPKIEKDVILVNGVVKNIVKSLPGNTEESCAVVDLEGNIYFNWDNKLTTKHINDFGILYPNFLYLAKIIVKYCYKNALGDYDTSDTTNFKTFYRWYWTNEMYNENYYSVEDFNELPFELSLDLIANYNTEKYKSEIKNHKVDVSDLNIPENNFGTTQEIITTNLKSTVDLGLLNSFNTFTLNPSILSEIYTYIGNKGIDASNANVISTEGKYTFDSPVLHSERIPVEEEEPVFNNDYKKLYNWQLLSTSKPKLEETKEFEYIDYKGNITTLSSPKYITLERINNLYSTTFDYKAILFSNYYKCLEVKKETLPCLRPLVYNKETAAQYGVLCPDDPKGQTELIPTIAGLISMGNFTEKVGRSAIGIEQACIGETSYDSKTDKIILKNSKFTDPCSGGTDGGGNGYWGLYGFYFNNLIGANNTGGPVEIHNKGFYLLRFFSLVDTSNLSQRGTGVFLGSAYKSVDSLGFTVGKSKGEAPYFYTAYYDKGFKFWLVSDESAYSYTNYKTEPSKKQLIPSFSAPPLFLCYVTDKQSIIPLNGYLGTRGNIPINQEIPNLADAKSLLENNAHYILNILTQFYIKDNNYENTIITNKDVIYLDVHKVLYSYDILYKTNTNKFDNTNLNMLNIQFSKYLNALLINISENVKKKKINYSNVTVLFLDILKNIPVLFNLITKIPEIIKTNNLYNAILMKITDLLKPNYEFIFINELLDNYLYYETSNREIKPYIGNPVTYNKYSSYKFDSTTGFLKYVTPATKKITDVSLFLGWEYDSGLKKLVPKISENDENPVVFNSWRTSWKTEEGNYHDWASWEFFICHGWYKNMTWPGAIKYWNI